MATDLCKVISPEFLSGNCMQILMNKFKPSKEKQHEEVNMALPTYIEQHYLRLQLKNWTHSSTKAAHIFNELCTSTFLNGKFEDFCKKEFEDIIRKNNLLNQQHRVAKAIDLSGGVLNQSGLAVLKKAEDLEKCGRGGYLCSIVKIKKVQVYWYMRKWS